MSTKITKAQGIKKRLLSIGLKITLFFIALFFITFIVISIPAVQTKLINRISETAFSKINHKLKLEYINVRWFDTVLIKGLLVYDTQSKTMIKADRVILDFKLAELITQNSINFDKVILQSASVEMLKNAPDGQFNINYFIDEIKNNLLKKQPGQKAKTFNTDKIILTNSRFKIYRDDKDPITHRFDQYHFTLQNIEANLLNFVLNQGDIDFDLSDFQCVDSATGLDVKKLKTIFSYTKKSMVFKNMDMKAGRSTISQSMVLNYLQPSSIKEFIDSVNITADVKKSIIHSKDLAHFAPALKKFNEYYRLKGFFEGPVKRFNVKNLSLQFGTSSELNGYLGMYGLPNFEETFINIKINSSKIYPHDLASYINEDSLESIKKFGLVKLEGRLSGFPGDFVTKARFMTNIGEIETDINLKIKQAEQGKTTYSGKLSTTNFDLGIFLGDTAFYQYVDLIGSINGSGFSREDAEIDLVSTISRIGIKGYDYQDITTDALMSEQFFHGSLKINDPNLHFNGIASIDLNRENELIQIKAELGKANLGELKLTDKPAFLKSTLNLDMRGLVLDEILGDIFLDSTYFKYGEKEITIDRLRLISERDSLSRSLKVQSPIADLHVFGDFNYTAFFRDLVNVYEEYKLILQNDSEDIKAYYSAQTADYSDYYYLDYDIDLKNINALINLFNPDFFLSDNTKIAGGFTGGSTKLIEVSSQIDSLTINKFSFGQNNIVFNTQKSSDTTLVYAQYHITSKNQRINGKQRSENLICEIDWNGNEIDFLFNVDQSNSTSYAKTSGKIEFFPDITQVHLNPSELNIIDKKWKFSNENLMIFKEKNYDIRNLSIYHEGQKIALNGKISEDLEDILYISIIDFDTKNLNPLITKRIDGVFKGFIEVKNFFNQREINSRINIKDFTINEFLVGNIIANSKLDDSKNHFDVNLSVHRNDVQTMMVNGFINPSGDLEQFNLNASLNNTNLNLIEPFFEDFISDVKGKLDGNILLTGTFDKPIIYGTGNTSNGEFTLDYLNTHYHLDGDVVFDSDYIDFNNFILTDNYDNKGTLDGRITHNGFKELGYNFYGSVEKFLVLNTTSKDNDLYYGTAFATGDLRIFGKEKVFNISANATSDKGTKFFIPLEGNEEVVKEEFINIISVNDTASLNIRETGKKMNLSGINLNLELDITPDAYCEIIFDLTAGDIIRGRGNGKINLQIDTKGDFNMFGDYEITEGGYNFTLYNIINKEFEVEPNSKISWIGDPYEAILDIQANYKQLTSLTSILKVTEEDIRINPELNRKYPAKVLLDIKGNLMYPEIEFGIDVEDYPKNATYNNVSFETTMTAFKNKLATDEQELKRQVFSLIILKKFIEENAFNVGGSVERSVSEFISNQISYWVTQFDENLVIDVDLGSLDEEAFNTFQLRMSYSFLDGRLRVTRDGGFTDQTTGANVASILGDWSVEYLLSPDGKLRAKIYNKTNYTSLESNLNSTTSMTTGFSLMHMQSFDEIKNMFKKSRDKNRPSKNAQQQEVPKGDGISHRSDSTFQF